MWSSKFAQILVLLCGVFLLMACGGGAQPTLSDADRIATRVAEDRSVASTLTAEAAEANGSAAPAETDTPLPPTNTVPPAASTNTSAPAAPTNTVPPINTVAPTNTSPPPATPTPIVIAVLPIDGGGGPARSISPENNGQNILLPGFSQAEVQQPMLFRDRINMSIALVQEPQSVTFEITDNDDESGNPVYAITDGRAPFCLLDVNAAECPPLNFAQNNFRWPNGRPIYNGDNYNVQITIQEENGDDSNWNSDFRIQGAQNRPYNGNASDFSGRWQTNFATVELQQSADQVSGFYTWYGSQQTISLQGTVNGNTLSGFYAGDSAKLFTFTMSQDGQSFDGAWDGAYQWCGVRGGPLPDGCGFSGFWESIGDYRPDYPPTMQVAQTGNQVQGTFVNGVSQSTGTFQGTIGPAGQYTAVGNWTIDGFSGQFRWALADFNAQQFRGYSVQADGSQHQWCGWRSGLNQPEPCFGQ